MVRHWDPFKDIAHLSEMMSRLLDEEVQHRLGAGQSVQSDWIPSVDLVELDDKFILKADVAGMARKDIKVEVVEAQLILKGERKINKPGEEEKYFRLERPYGKFCRDPPAPRGSQLQRRPRHAQGRGPRSNAAQSGKAPDPQNSNQVRS